MNIQYKGKSYELKFKKYPNNNTGAVLHRPEQEIVLTNQVALELEEYHIPFKADLDMEIINQLFDNKIVGIKFGDIGDDTVVMVLLYGPYKVKEIKPLSNHLLDVYVANLKNELNRRHVHPEEIFFTFSAILLALPDDEVDTAHPDNEQFLENIASLCSSIVDGDSEKWFEEKNRRLNKSDASLN